MLPAFEHRLEDIALVHLRVADEGDHAALRTLAAEAVGALNRAAGHVRSEIAKRMHIRKAPEFRFVADDGAKYAAHINELIAGLEREER